MPLASFLTAVPGEQRRKVVLLGSGGLSIGQAGEFDYSGTQALRALVQENLDVIVVNPNIATVQTNPGPHIQVYLYPVTWQWVEKIIIQEQPVAIVAGFGGQTALKCLLDLEERGILERYGVQNLGTSPQTLRLSEDRDLFAQKMTEIGVPTPPSEACHAVEEAAAAAERIGYPVICRMAYALGGLGSGFADNRQELVALVEQGLAHSPQVLVEKSLKGWKELEYEVMQDGEGNAICICNMENFDPLGIHTGDSIVVCPSQTLSDDEYQLLRNCSLKVVKELGVLGECNAQFALCPESLDYFIIEVNARLSRSSALASKASGYPIAYVAAKVILGYDLLELKNPVTGVTCAFFEPALDYVTLKVPRWDLMKFKGARRELGSTMKSVGEIMAIGRTFCEVVQKAVRSVEEIACGLSWYDDVIPKQQLCEALKVPTDRRLYEILQACRQGLTLQQVREKTHIDLWFLQQLYDLIASEDSIRRTFRQSFARHGMSTKRDQAQTQNSQRLSSQSGSSLPSLSEVEEVVLHTLQGLDQSTWRQWKVMGFSDEQIVYLGLREIFDREDLSAQAMQKLSLKARAMRVAHQVVPYVKRIDTTAAEYPSTSNYLYMTYAASYHDPISHDQRPRAIIVGGGSYRIGTSVEFDWCAVSCSEQLRKNGWSSVMVNCNPETVSTDFNVSDYLYFEEVSLERILDIHDFASSYGVIASVGGQLPNRLALSLARSGLKLLGHDAHTIDMAEDRNKFSEILDKLHIDQPRWTSARSMEDVEEFIATVGFPVLVRPSYVLSGAAMRIVHNKESLVQCLLRAEKISLDHPVVLSEFVVGAREIEVDGVAHHGEILISIVSEHIENAGVHSGDATTVVPAQKLYVETVRGVKRAARRIAQKLCLNGPFNIQFLARQNHIQVIECNARAARSFPFISKIVGCHLLEIATDVMIGRSAHISHFMEDELPHVGVKAALFSFTRLRGADPVLGVEMASTGEVGCVAANFHEAMLLALEASKTSPPQKGLLISAGQEKNKLKFLSSARLLIEMGVPLYATAGTAAYLQQRGIAVTSLPWPVSSGPEDAAAGSDPVQDVLWAIRTGVVDFVVNVPKNLEKKELTDGARIRQTAVTFNCSLMTDMEKAISYIQALYDYPQLLQTHTLVPLPPWRQVSETSLSFSPAPVRTTPHPV